MLTPDRLEEITRYCLDGIALPPEMQRELLNEIERMRKGRAVVIRDMAKVTCPLPPKCPDDFAPESAGTCIECWTKYFNDKEAQP